MASERVERARRAVDARSFGRAGGTWRRPLERPGRGNVRKWLASHPKLRLLLGMAIGVAVYFVFEALRLGTAAYFLTMMFLAFTLALWSATREEGTRRHHEGGDDARP